MAVYLLAAAVKQEARGIRGAHSRASVFQRSQLDPCAVVGGNLLFPCGSRGLSPCGVIYGMPLWCPARCRRPADAAAVARGLGLSLHYSIMFSSQLVFCSCAIALGGGGLPVRCGSQGLTTCGFVVLGASCFCWAACSLFLCNCHGTGCSNEARAQLKQIRQRGRLAI